ncbi:polar amino acid transport system substrate-binding protein [Nocardioides albertanoniae]|uniref:Polar amino acid transport system substrate-binding protein n=1 Tax=Nocardioides albertanoniae TaxID=1175486 RepID=A0A543AD51_9ACTN|nr:transporter substrate-binding domain-containing protein [Nocardioides albertanoniae]TQL70511.1 polar amino acid transport system substrate-binding protein [Nocardioides albertanoniae]
MNLRKLAAALTVPALGLALTACGGGDEAGKSPSGAKLVKADTLTICTHLPYKPFEFNEGGEVVGFDIDVLKIAADAEKLETEVVNIGWETIVSGEALNSGKCDVAAGAMTINEERQKVMDFSEPYFEATQALLTKKGAGYAALDDLGGKTIAVQEATTGADYVKENAPKDTKIITLEDSALMMQAVKSGKADAGVNDNGLLYDFVKDNSDMEITGEFQTGEAYGFSVKKGGNDKLVDVINKAVNDKTAYDKVFKKWFGEAAAQ